MVTYLGDQCTGRTVPVLQPEAGFCDFVRALGFENLLD